MDGLINGLEECDDGNTIDDDACSNSSIINPALIPSGQYKSCSGNP